MFQEFATGIDSSCTSRVLSFDDASWWTSSPTLLMLGDILIKLNSGCILFNSAVATSFQIRFFLGFFRLLLCYENVPYHLGSEFSFDNVVRIYRDFGQGLRLGGLEINLLAGAGWRESKERRALDWISTRSRTSCFVRSKASFRNLCCWSGISIYDSVCYSVTSLSSSPPKLFNSTWGGTWSFKGSVVPKTPRCTPQSAHGKTSFGVTIHLHSETSTAAPENRRAYWLLCGCCTFTSAAADWMTREEFQLPCSKVMDIAAIYAVPGNWN